MEEDLELLVQLGVCAIRGFSSPMSFLPYCLPENQDLTLMMEINQKTNLWFLFYYTCRHEGLANQSRLLLGTRILEHRTRFWSILNGVKFTLTLIPQISDSFLICKTERSNFWSTVSVLTVDTLRGLSRGPYISAPTTPPAPYGKL